MGRAEQISSKADRCAGSVPAGRKQKRIQRYGEGGQRERWTADDEANPDLQTLLKRQKHEVRLWDNTHSQANSHGGNTPLFKELRSATAWSRLRALLAVKWQQQQLPCPCPRCLSNALAGARPLSNSTSLQGAADMDAALA